MSHGESAGKRAILIRGYVEQTPDLRWRGIYLTLNLAVEGRSLEEVQDKLRSLARAYLADAVVENDLDRMYPRRAPLSYYARYYWILVSSIINRIIDRPSGNWILFSYSDSSLVPNA